ncbi:glycosyltransferase 61 family protein [Paracoccus fistulariae]|uniref:Glycosyltransferase family 61 protein n=1 Tax=Paracoccus fistulariae TaxID=658446 RepID=A0ABY7SI27_9RHOB|nr:glycosyltransferase 61 family protein [Paracoccus fistulariae]MDB6182111.1 glycosyltransferase 61 family protein [Paracoccus fistulariae]WCR06661.1 glycosyltransferase family 61 protein [Paracoccus fistulariae]
MKTAAAQWLGHLSSKTFARLSGRRFEFDRTPPFKPTRAGKRVPCRPALFDPEHLSRVTQCAFGASLDDLHKVMTADHYIENPLETLELTDAIVIGGVIFADGKALIHSKFVHPGLGDVVKSTPVMDDTVLINSMPGLRYFGHWLGDDTTAFEAYRQHPGLVSLPLPSWDNVPVYAGLFDHNWDQRMVLRSRKLTLVRDLGFSLDKADRYRTLRDRLRQNFGSLPENRSKVVFLRRGPSGDPRQIVNSSELERRLDAAGVQIVTAEGDTHQLIADMLDATIIISIEGSQDRHASYNLRDGGGMLSLLPPDRFYVSTHEWVRNLELNSGIVIGHAAEGGITIDPDEVLAMIDKLLARIETLDAV